MPILSAGYIIDEVAAYLQEEGLQSWLEQLVVHADFELQYNREVEETKGLDATWSVFNNLISRGVLARCPFDSALHILQYILDRKLSLVNHQGNLCIGTAPGQFQNLGYPAVEPESLTWQEAYSNEATFAWSTLLFSPILIARIQKALVHLVHIGLLDIHASSWRLLIIERDVPGAALAISELQRLLDALYSLQGVDTTLPAIHIRVVASSEETATGFSSPELLVSAESCRAEDFDLVIDASAFAHELAPLFQASADILYVSIKPQTGLASIEPEARFYFEESISYFSLYNNESHTSQGSDQDTEKALSYLLKNVCRSTDDPAALLPLLTAVWTEQSPLIWDSSSQKRNTIQVLAALLQPAYSIWICPEEWDRIRQEELLASHRIGDYLLRKNEGYPKLSSLFPQNSYLSVQTPEFFTQEVISKDFTDSYVGYAFIQDAHRVSLWSPAYHILYPSLLAKLQTCLPSLQVLPSTGLLTFDILRDIQRYFQVSYDFIGREEIEKVERDFVTYKVVPVSFRSSSTLSKNPRKGVSMVKFPLIRRILKNISFELPGVGNSLLENRSSTDTFSTDSPIGLIYLGNTSLGTTEDLKKYLESEKMAVSVFEEVEQELKENKTNTSFLSLANSAGVLASDILLTRSQQETPTQVFPTQYTIHFQHPDRLENFYLETDIPISSNLSTNSFIIFDQSVEQHRKDPSGQDLNEFTSQYSFSNPAKDSQILQELFEEISYPEDFFATYLTAKLRKITGEELQIRFTFERYGEGFLNIYAYVSVPSSVSYQQKLVARIGLSNLSIQIEEQEGIDTDKVRTFAQAATAILHKFHPRNEWVDSTLQFVGKGITTILDEVEDIPVALTLCYENNAMVQLIDLIRTEGNYELTFKEIQSQYHRTHSFPTFIEGLQELSKSFSLSEGSRDLVEEFYSKIREKRNTLNALSQLEHMGLIDGIDLEDDLGVCHIYFSQKNEGYYQEKLRKFIRYYGGVEIEKKWMDRLHFDEEQVGKEKIAYEFSRFFHDFIASRKKNSLIHGARAMEWGMEKGSQGVQEYIKHYFFSLYALTDFLPKSLEEESTPMVLLKKYLGFLVNTPSILELGSTWSNLMHLASSCHQIREGGRPEHSTLLQVLQSFAELGLTFESEEQIDIQREKAEAGLENLIEGMLTLQMGAEVEMREWMEVLDKMEEVAERIHTDFGKRIRETQNIFLASYYSQWLRNFNRKFIDAPVVN